MFRAPNRLIAAFSAIPAEAMEQLIELA
jgi:hypothetical protein